MSSGLYSHTTRGIGTVLTAAIYNADHNNHITNANPSQHGGYSDSVPEMQTMVNPGGVGTEVLASNLAGEIARLRYVINRIAGTTHWYEAPVTSLAIIGGGIPLTLAFASTPLTLRRTENDTTAREILSLGSGSGVGNKMNIQAVGTGANAIGELRWLLGATELFRMTAALFTYFFAQEFRSYADILSISDPAAPASGYCRFYAKDIGSGVIRLALKDPAGSEFILGQPSVGAFNSDEYTATTTTTTLIPMDGTVPTSSEGIEILSAALTLNEADSKVQIDVSGCMIANNAGRGVISIFRGTTCIAARAFNLPGGNLPNSIDTTLYDTPGSVGPHTYSVRYGGGSAGTYRMNGGGSDFGIASKTVLTVREILI